LGREFANIPALSQTKNTYEKAETTKMRAYFTMVNIVK
jgi:hypothetical protein